MNGCPLLVIKLLTPSLCREARASGEGQEHKGRKSEAVRRRQRAGGPREARFCASGPGTSWTRSCGHKEPAGGSVQAASRHQVAALPPVSASTCQGRLAGPRPPGGPAEGPEGPEPRLSADASKAAAVSPSNRKEGSDPGGGVGGAATWLMLALNTDASLPHSEHCLLCRC